MSSKKQIVLASHNQGKIRELSLLLADLGIEVLSQADFAIADVAETGLSFVENAIIKARHAAKLSGLPALADDSGLCVDALLGAPAIYSARYAGEHGNDAANMARLLAEMADKSCRRARFVCVLAFCRHADDPTPIIAQGQWWGEIALEAQGEGGFGYDPVFYLPELGKTAAQLSAVEKNQMSHRAKALQAFKHQLLHDEQGL